VGIGEDVRCAGPITSARRRPVSTSTRMIGRSRRPRTVSWNGLTGGRVGEWRASVDLLVAPDHPRSYPEPTDHLLRRLEVAVIPGGQRRRILVVVKTYPNPSQSYVETVCCAGVDLDTRSWVRMYPITFRRLADKKFAKYQVITCAVGQPRGDNRPESLRVDQDTIQLVGEPMAAGDRGWRRRMASLPPSSKSLEEIQETQRRDGTSLGMFRPKQIKRLVKRRAKPWNERQRAALRQQRLGLGEAELAELADLEQIPWSFAYEFTCADARCTGHELGILDWEIGESYRQWSRQYGDRWEEKLRERYEVELPARDLHFVVGNLAKRRHTFEIIGLVRPPRAKVANSGFVQETLDLMGEQRPVAGAGVGLEAEQADPLGLDQRHEVLELFPGEA
jgi:hypothetical protein